MATRHLSLRVEDDMVARLDKLAKHEHLSRSEMTRTLIEEGLRMAAHPGILFVSGPAGRRPRVVTGPDVWEAARVYREFRDEPDRGIDKTAQLMGRHRVTIEVVADYYDKYADEIDEWIRELDDYAEAAEAEWLRAREDAAQVTASRTA